MIVLRWPVMTGGFEWESGARSVNSRYRRPKTEIAMSTSCAPDQVSRPFTESIFYPVNGFAYEGNEGVIYKETSHLWVITPDNITDLIDNQ